MYLFWKRIILLYWQGAFHLCTIDTVSNSDTVSISINNVEHIDRFRKSDCLTDRTRDKHVCLEIRAWLDYTSSMIIGLALYVVRRMRHLARRVCIALSYVRGIIEPFAGFRSHSEGGPSFREIVCGRESYWFRRGRNRRDKKPVTYHRVRQHVYDRCHILSYARHIRVSAASCCCRGGCMPLLGYVMHKSVKGSVKIFVTAASMRVLSTCLSCLFTR